MAKVTSKLQVTVPKAIADAHGIKPGDEIEFQSAGDVIRVVPAARVSSPKAEVARRLRLFDAATKRQRAREAGRAPAMPGDRGWTREELYDRGRAR